MKGMILAAGEGTRLGPLTAARPKPMLPIGGRPLLEHLVVLLREHGIQEIAINLHYKPEVITSHFGDGTRYGVHLVYSFEDQLLGTAGAVKKLQGFLDETFVLLYGDVMTNADLTAMARYHRQKGGIGTIGLYHVENPSACGLVDMDATNRILRFVEKPPPEQVFTDLANAGILILEPEVINHIPQGTFCDFGLHIFPQLVAAGMALYGYVMPDYVIDIGTPEKYAQAQRDYQAGKLGKHTQRASSMVLDGLGGDRR